MLAETIFKKFFPGREYEIESENNIDRVSGKGCKVMHNREFRVLMAKRQGDQYGERYLLNLKGDEIDSLKAMIGITKCPTCMGGGYQIMSKSIWDIGQELTPCQDCGGTGQK